MPRPRNVRRIASPSLLPERRTMTPPHTPAGTCRRRRGLSTKIPALVQETILVYRRAGLLALVTLTAACAASSPQPPASNAASDAAAHQAHEAYVTAINSNNLDDLLGMLTDDVVFLS